MFGQQNFNAYQQPIYGQPGYGQIMQQPVYRNESQGMSNFGNQGGSTGTSNGQTLIWLSGEQAAWDYLVAPNNAVHIRDTTQPRLYVKRADSSGKPSLQIYDRVERTAQQNAPAMPAAQSQPVITREEFDGIKRELEALKEQYGKITREESNE